MIPTGTDISSNEEEVVDFEYESQPDLTYKLNIENERIAGYVDKLEAYKQAVYKIINTERYDHLIYSWNYGVELKELFGTSVSYAVPEIEQRITEAVMQDDRTQVVYGFEFEQPKKGVLHVTFRCKCSYGTVVMSKDVEI